MAAFIGPLIGLGASAIGSLFHKKPKPDPMIAQLQSQQQIGMSDARAALQPVKDYYTTALSGDSEALKQLLGPEINTVLSQYDTAAKTATELGPRGAGKNAALAAVPFAKATAYGKALSGARSGAAEGLTKIGTAEEGTNAGLASSLLSANSEKNRLDQEKDVANNSALSNFGAGLGSLLTTKGANGKNAIGDIGGFLSRIFTKHGGRSFDSTYGGGSGNTE